VEQISRIGMDTSKHIFQLHGVTAAEEPVLRKKLRRKEMFAFLEMLAPTVIAIEACGTSHHCARLLQSFGHSVKLIAPQLVKPYVKRGKDDAADAEALCAAMSRPTMRFAPVKTAEQQAALMLVGARDRLIRNRTQLTNAIRGHSTAGKVRLGVITRAGDKGLRSVLVVGATTVIQHAQRGGRPSPWLTELLKRKSPKLAAVALANKMARIAWKLMITGQTYTAKSAPAALAGAA